jgi:tetratricopeptide (TPR) repeat protein
MNEPNEPNRTVDAPSVPADPVRVADPTTIDNVPGSASTHGSHPGADEPARDLPVVPGYLVLRDIARGGMGRILAAHEVGLDRDVALKILLPGASADRFVRESKITARLPHPGVPPVHALGTLADGSPFLAMKLVAGHTLAVEMKTADRPRLLQVFTQVCQAVGFAHSRGVVHRDLKPANVMVGAFGEVHVMDWGLAKELSDREPADEPRSAEALPQPLVGTTSTRTTDYEPSRESADDQTQMGTVLGTPSYMAPEQARGEAATARADVFALGGILCAILTGKPPFTGKLAAEVVRRAAAADLAEAHARLGGCGADEEVLELCRRCLSPSPADRPADGQAVANELTTHLNGVQGRLRAAELARAAESARAEEATERAKAERRARRIQVIAASLLLLVLAGGIVGTTVGLFRAERAKEQAVYAEGETKKRADELKKVADYQAKMLQLDAAETGVKLMAELRARHGAALEKGKLPQAEKLARMAAFDRELHAFNATDTAVALLDRTVLAPAVQTIESQFADQPLVDASLRATLGGVYHKLGRPEQALALYRRAYELRAASLGEDDLDTLLSRSGVGKVLGELQKLPEAESTIRATLMAYQRVLGDDHKETLDAKSLLAQQLSYQGKYEESEAIARDVLERRRRVQGPDHADTFIAMKDLGLYLMKRGQYADAVRVFREVVEAQRRLAEPSIAASLSDLGIVLNRQRDYAAAEPYLREALELNRRDLGEDHPITVTDMSNLAALLMDLGKLPEAEALAKEVLGKRRRLQGNEHADTLKAINVMGQVLFRQNKFSETEPYYREALATGRKALGEEHPDTIIWLANLGVLLQRLGRLAEAELLLRDSLDKNRRQQGESHPNTLTMMTLLVDNLSQQDRPAEAEGYLRAALEVVRRKYGEDHWEMLRLIGNLGGVLREQGKLAEAETYFQQTVEKNRRLHGEEHPDTLTAILRMGGLRVAQGQYTEALAMLTPIQGKFRKAIPGNVGLFRDASLVGMMGKARSRLAKEPVEFTTAEANLLEAQSVFTRFRGAQVKETREWAQALVDLYGAWDKAEPGKGYDAKAAAWKKNLPTKPSPPREKK